MKRNIFLLVPSPSATGPIKGAHALANALCEDRSVHLVTLKDEGVTKPVLSARIQRISLARETSFADKVRAYRKLISEAGGRAHVASISMCLSADAVNLACGKHAVTCSSVRGNLLRNYRSDYGIPGVPLALLHLASLRAMDHVVAMTSAMARQIKRYTGVMPRIIGNFVDEPALDVYRSRVCDEGPSSRCVFLGSLTSRKQPLLAVKVIAELRRRGIDVALDIVGDGPLRSDVEREIQLLEASSYIRIHGFQSQPYSLLASAHALLLPSLSEGISRACLEALHLGIPCVLRDSDGNSELIEQSVNGALFRRDDELLDAVLAALRISRQDGYARESLLPPAFRQAPSARAYLELVEGI